MAPLSTRGPTRHPPGEQTPCVNPAGPDDGKPLPFAGSLVPSRTRELQVDDVATPYVLLPRTYAGRCVRLPDGFAYLAMVPAADSSVKPISLDEWRFNGRLGSTSGIPSR